MNRDDISSDMAEAAYPSGAVDPHTDKKGGASRCFVELSKC